jgi:REP element-mobilizing transposase RayT
VLKRRFPVHVTWRMRKDLPWLRKPRCFRALARAFWGGCNRFGFRLIHYSVQGNHMHLLVEAVDEKSLARGMNGLGVRVARGLNKALGRHGKVLDERYHGHILRTPTEVRRARVYLDGNARRHFGLAGADPYASRAPLVAPVTFLMRQLR